MQEQLLRGIKNLSIPYPCVKNIEKALEKIRFEFSGQKLIIAILKNAQQSRNLPSHYGLIAHA